MTVLQWNLVDFFWDSVETELQFFSNIYLLTIMHSRGCCCRRLPCLFVKHFGNWSDLARVTVNLERPSMQSWRLLGANQIFEIEMQACLGILLALESKKRAPVKWWFKYNCICHWALSSNFGCMMLHGFIVFVRKPTAGSYNYRPEWPNDIRMPWNQEPAVWFRNHSPHFLVPRRCSQNMARRACLRGDGVPSVMDRATGSCWR